ncbi:hypothetical protein D9M71_286670 [compost metagenome]
MHGRAGVELVGRGGVGVRQHRKQFVAHLGVVPGQAPLPQRAVATAADFQGGGGLVLQRDRLALGACRGAAAFWESDVRAIDQRPRMWRLDRAAEIAEQLQVRCQLVAQAHARGVVPVVQAGLATFLRVGDSAFTAGVDRGEAGGQPQVVGDLQVIADMQDRVRALVGEVADQRARCVTGGVAGGDAHELAGTGVGQVFGHSQAQGALAFQPPERVATLVVERAADIRVRHLQAVGALAQVHGIVVVDKTGLDARIVIDVPGGLVADKGAARLVAVVVPRHVGRVGRPWVVLDGVFGHPSREIVVGLAVAQVEACFQVGVEAIAEVGDDTLALAGRVVLIAVGVGVGHGHVVIEGAEHLSGADLALLIAVTARCVAYLQLRRVVAGMADVIDGPAKSQGAPVESVGAAQHLHVVEPQRFQQFIGRAAGAGQRQTVEHGVQPRGMGTRCTIDPRSADRDLHPFVARRLGIDPRLVSQHILIAGHAALQRTAHVDHVGAAGHLGQPGPGVLDPLVFVALVLSANQHLSQLQALSLGHGRTNKGQAQQRSGQGMRRGHWENSRRTGTGNEQCDARRNEGSTWQFCYFARQGLAAIDSAAVPAMRTYRASANPPSKPVGRRRSAGSANRGRQCVAAPASGPVPG